MTAFPRLLKFVAVSALAICAFFSKAGVIIGSNDGGNCYPFSCFASDGGGVKYQQIYDSNLFSGLSTISAIKFFQYQAGMMDNASYSISFYQSARAVNGLSSLAADNTGTLLANFGVFNVSGAMPSMLLFDGIDFAYNPALGNLLMEVNVLGLNEAFGYQSFFQADYTGTQTQRFFSTDGINGSTGVGALVTEFEFGRAIPTPSVPSPSALALIALGLCSMRLTSRRGKKS